MKYLNIEMLMKEKLVKKVILETGEEVEITAKGRYVFKDQKLCHLCNYQTICPWYLEAHKEKAH